MSDIPRPFDRTRDLARVGRLAGRLRAAGGVWHPGGLQWWLRRTIEPQFEAHVVDDAGEITGFVLIEDIYVIALAADPAARIALIDWAAGHLRTQGAGEIEVSLVEGEGVLGPALAARGYAPSGTWGDELMLDIGTDPPAPRLPPGFSFGSLETVDDDAYVELHRDAWSDTRPSRYRRALHDLVTSAPQFRRDLVTIAVAHDGTPAASCIGWLDRLTQTLEIEPLGTRPAYRRLGLGHAIVAEVVRRAWANGMKHVLVWGTSENERAYRLYTSSGFTPRRHLIEVRKTLVAPSSADRDRDSATPA
jgi:GNAT superfamily N-acetyltransferase